MEISILFPEFPLRLALHQLHKLHSQRMHIFLKNLQYITMRRLQSNNTTFQILNFFYFPFLKFVKFALLQSI